MLIRIKNINKNNKSLELIYVTTMEKKPTNNTINSKITRYASLKSAFNFTPETRFDLCLTATHADPINFDLIFFKSRISFVCFFCSISSCVSFCSFVRCERKPKQTKRKLRKIFVANIFENSIFTN